MAATVAAAAPASAAVGTDDGGNVPFYARISTIGTPDQIFHDDQWAVIVIYRPPECRALVRRMSVLRIVQRREHRTGAASLKHRSSAGVCRSRAGRSVRT
jgi:hypothetical protein